MPLRFDQMIPASSKVEVVLFPGFHGFRSGHLHGLFGALNAEEEFFNHLSIRKMPSAKFDGDDWHYSITEKIITVESDGNHSHDEFCSRVAELLTDTRKYFQSRAVGRSVRFMLADTVELSTLVPEDKNKDVGNIVKSKPLGRIKTEHYAELPGNVAGAGLRLVGGTEDYGYEVAVAPSLARNDDLYISAELTFPFPDEPPSDDVSAVTDAVQTTARFLNNHLASFAAAILPESTRRKPQEEDDE